jgi:peptidoglycan/LPS O-acetylase OafA/YrhL
LASIPFVLTFTQNITLYWGKQPPGAYPALDHTWTLGIEEQFYLIWPALVIWAGRKRFVPLCGLTIALALAARSDSNWLLPKLNDRLLLARCDGFAVGGLLAFWLEDGGWLARSHVKATRYFAGAAGLALTYFAWGCLWDDKPLGFIGLPTPKYPAETIFAFAVLYAGIIGLFAVNSGSRWLKPFRLGPVVYLGQISYGLYLYHYVVYWIIDGCQVGPHQNNTAQPWTTQAFKLGASLAAAMISWHLIERPILRWKDRFGYRVSARERLEP